MAVYTEVTEGALLRYLADFDIPPLESFSGIEAGVENTNYFLDTSGQRFVLTLFEKRTSGSDLPFFTGLMAHLASKALPCPMPLLRVNGESTAELHGKPAVIVSCLPGSALEVPNSAHCEKAGAMLARLHNAAADYDQRRASTMSLAEWRAMADKIGVSAANIQPGLPETIRNELSYLEARWPSDTPIGTIHGDFFPDNVLWQSDEISGVIDFYFACDDALAYDLALTLNAWCFSERGEIDQEAARALITGYTSVRDLGPTEISAWPTYLRGAAMRILLTRIFDQLFGDSDALVVPKDPMEYLNILTFHQQDREPTYYGL